MKILISIIISFILCLQAGCSKYPRLREDSEQSVHFYSLHCENNVQNHCSAILSEDYDYLLVFVYGQSYTVARDGGYCVTDSIDDNLYALGSVSSTTGSYLVRVKDTDSAQNENVAISAVDIIAKLCKEYIDKPVYFIIGNEGRGSRTVLELMKESSVRSLLSCEEMEEFESLDTYENRYSRVTDYLRNLKQWAEKNDKKVLCPFFIYLQGESDTHIGVKRHGIISSAGGDYSRYKERLSILLSDLKKDIVEATGQSIEPAAFIDNVGNGQFNDNLSGISQAQTDLTRELDDVYSCGPYYAYPSYGSHPTPDGRRWLGEAIAKLFYSAFVDGEDRSIYIDSYAVSGNEVVLNVNTKYPPLVFDNYTAKKHDDGGFRAFDNKMNGIKINSLTVKDSQIILSFKSLPKEDFYISYGGDGLGNVRDSDDWQSTYKYSSNDIGNMPSLAHYPVDKTGNPIIGRHYPMWNWLPFGFVRIRL